MKKREREKRKYHVDQDQKQIPRNKSNERWTENYKYFQEKWKKCR